MALTVNIIRPLKDVIFDLTNQSFHRYYNLLKFSVVGKN